MRLLGVCLGVGTMRETSSSERPEPPSIRICCSFPVPRSFAVTWMIPFASMSNETSTCGIPARRRGDPDELELAEGLVEGGHLRLALQDVDLDGGLVVLRGRERLRLARRDRRVPLDELRHHAALRLDPERERGHVEQEHVLHVALEHACLDRGADGHDLVRVDALVRVLADELLDLLLHGRHPGHAADEDDVVDRRGVEPGVRERLLRRADRPFEQVVRQLLQLRARQLEVEMLRALRGRGHERQVDLRRHRRGELDLRLLRGLVQPLEGHLVLRQVDPLVLLELGGHPVDDLPCRSCRRRGGCRRSSTSPRRPRRRARAPTRRTSRRRGRTRGSSGRRLPCPGRTRARRRSAR